MSLRVLHVLDHSIPLHSGYSFRSRAIIDGQRALGWETHHLTGPKQGQISALVETVDGLTFHRSSPSRWWIESFPVTGHLAVARGLEKRLDSVVRTVRPDVIQAHSPALNGLAALRVARRHRLPVAYEVRAFWEDAAVDHGTTREGSIRYRLTRALETYVLRRVDAVTCICEGLRSEILSRGVAPDRVTVIPNAVDAARFTFKPPSDNELGRSLGLLEGPVLGFIGSFYAYEGLDLLLRAMVDLGQDMPRACVLLVGGGPQADYLRAKARELGVEGRVIFAGRVPHDQVARYYGLVDLFVYPRRSMRLTDLVTPLKPLEAMAHGRVTIASDVGGHRELIEDGENGILFPAGDAHALAHAVRHVLADADLAKRIVEQGRKYVERERTWSRSVAGYESVFAALVGSMANQRDGRAHEPLP